MGVQPQVIGNLTPSGEFITQGFTSLQKLTLPPRCSFTMLSLAALLLDGAASSAPAEALEWG